MAKSPKRACPECGDTVPAEPINAINPINPIGRRSFLKAAGVGAAALAASRLPAWAQDAKPADTSNKTAEELIKELYTGMSDDQKKAVILPITSPERMKIYNAALGKKIGEAYTKPQQELVGRILRSIASGEEGWNQLSRGGTWDASKAFENCGANLFGDVSGKYTWVFTGHHLTIRCDGNTEDGVAFGGPLYYGHSPNGYVERNLFQYQTKSALAVFEALNPEQRKVAVCADKPTEGLPSVQFRASGDKRPGIAVSELSKEAQALVEKVMRDLLSPYRKTDADEVMQVVKAQGNEKMNLAFYAEPDAKATQPWSFWRLEAPGFVWNFRVLPHVHTFVNISAKI
jgi:hypothetical protein